ncbi:MAG: helix-turn-helix transcriptional regulator [Thalassovita sp.]
MDVQDPDGWFAAEFATFGDRLAAARDHAGMDQRTLAKRLGTKLKTLQDWEYDLSEPRANKLSMLSGLLNVSIKWLLTGEGEGVTEPVDDPAISADINALLTEIREIKVELSSSADRLGKLEKQLRLKLKGT